mgnify:CR=1 FL=1
MLGILEFEKSSYQSGSLIDTADGVIGSGMFNELAMGTADTSFMLICAKDIELININKINSCFFMF